MFNLKIGFVAFSLNVINTSNYCSNHFYINILKINYFTLNSLLSKINFIK